MSGTDHYTRTNVYDFVHSAVEAQFPDAYISGVYEPVPQSFPSVYIREISRFSSERNVTFSGEQGVKSNTFEVQVQTAAENSSLEEAYEMMDFVIGTFQSLFYINTAVNTLENGDRGLYRLTATFRKINGIADTMPSLVINDNNGQHNSEGDTP